MPRVETIKDVKIYVYSQDHVPPHVHAIYGEYEAKVDIRKLEIIEGLLPPKKRKTAIEFVETNQIELLELLVVI